MGLLSVPFFNKYYKEEKRGIIKKYYKDVYLLQLQCLVIQFFNLKYFVETLVCKRFEDNCAVLLLCFNFLSFALNSNCGWHSNDMFQYALLSHVAQVFHLIKVNTLTM